MTTASLPDLHEDVFLTTEELASLLRVPISTLYVWRSRGGGPPAYKVGRRTLYRRDDVEVWLGKQRQA